MKLLAHLNRSVHQLQDCLHLSRPEARHARHRGPQGGGVVITVALLSMAAASILVLAP
ncbi:hypothetical protein SNE35_05950 [Paucibacter sp. R3-3]|uniref:Uncharacterized protein n=1 Tax=Roseateles agri TaxID=3098619 RepID=A0ABU5DCM7_9BURK|nr:hypothetical protein [Paucibacter sp. R3-3]MDY0744036.1 hypothetical protein [Paucibacter sp. R3-3]